MTSLSQRLRQKLLDLAIRGKLVPQNARDEPADELLARIRKARSAQKGRARAPAAPLPVTDDEQPFDLPKGWCWCRLGDIADIQLGKMLDAEKNKGRSFRYLANVSVRWGSFDLANLKTTLFADDEVERFALRPNDLLMCEGGVPGRCAVWREQNSDVKYQKALHRIRFTECLPDFYQIYFETIHKSGFFVERFTGSTIHHLPREVLIGVPIPLPPLAEQKRIVAALDEMLAAADAVASGTEKIATLKDKVRAKILDLAIRGKIVKQDCNDEPANELLTRIRNEELGIRNGRARRTPHSAFFAARFARGMPETVESISDDEKPFDLPKGWAWCRLGEIGNWGAGTTPSRKNAAYYEGGEIPWLKTGDLNDGVVTGVPEFVTQKAIDETSLHLNPIGSVLIAMYGATIGKVGILGIEATTNQACCACQVAGCVVHKYLFYYLLSQRSKLKAMGGGGAQPNISKDIIVSFPIPLPPLAEQKRIVAKVDEMLAACDAISATTNTDFGKAVR